MRHQNLIILACLILGFMVPASSFAQFGNSSKPPDEDSRSMLLSLKIWKITEELKVDETLAAKLYPRIRELEALLISEHDKMTSDMDSLRKILEENESSTKLESAIQSVRNRHRDQLLKINSAQDRILELLTPEQQAKYLILDFEFHKKIRSYLRGHDRKDRPNRETKRQNKHRDQSNRSTDN